MRSRGVAEEKLRGSSVNFELNMRSRGVAEVQGEPFKGQKPEAFYALRIAILQPKISLYLVRGSRTPSATELAVRHSTHWYSITNTMVPCGKVPSVSTLLKFPITRGRLRSA